MILRLQKYNLVVKYCPGTQMYIADMLSRAYLKEQQCKETPPYQILQLQHEAAVFRAIEDINITLQTLLTTVLSGWLPT